MREIDLIKDVKNAPNRYIDSTGDNITGGLNFIGTFDPLNLIFTSNNEQNARGIKFENNNRKVEGQIGALFDRQDPKHIYIGLTGTPWDGNNSLLVKKDGCYFNNRKIYNEGFKPSLSDLGAASISHNHDDLYFRKGNWSTNNGQDLLVHGKRALVGTPDGSLYLGYGGDFQRLFFGTSRIYHEGFKPSPTDIGALGRTEKAVSAGTADRATNAGNADTVSGKNFVWEFGSGNPTHIWGSSGNSNKMQVWSPSNITVGRASNADAVEWNNVRNKPSSFNPSNPHSFSVSGRNNSGTNSSNDLNTIWKSGFYEISSGSNKPDQSDWHWVIHAGHTSNRSDYKYGMQIAAGNNTNNFYIRTTNQSGTGEWGKIYTTKNKPTPDEIGAMRDSGSYRTLYLSDWIRTKGQSGIYFQDFSGGWHMTDSTWIRAYQDKGIYTGGTIKASNMKIGENNVYHEGRPPSCADINAMSLRKLSPDDYYVMGDIFGSFADYIRTTESGILPFAPDVSYLGDIGMRFSHIYGNTGDFNNVIVNGPSSKVLMNGNVGDSGSLCMGWNNTIMGKIKVLSGTYYDITSSRWLKIYAADENNKEDAMLSINAENANWIIHSASMHGQADNARDLGSSSYRYRKVYCAGGVVTSSDENMKQHINYIDLKPKRIRDNNINLIAINNEEDINKFVINTNDCYNFIKDTPYATYFYKQKVRPDASTTECENADKNNTLLMPTSENFMVGFIAQDIVQTKVGKMFLDSYDKTGYNYNINNYVGIIAKALQESILKIEALESLLLK